SASDVCIPLVVLATTNRGDNWPLSTGNGHRRGRPSGSSSSDPVAGSTVAVSRRRRIEDAIHSDRTTSTDMYGKFYVEPFERGFGMTIGNSSRRISLSSLEGSAVTRVKIGGVQHEISTITGVVEDVTDIISNIKSSVVK
ncbi:hypothetical protein OY671_012317, partial [Metschnikowia pulcherrima]